MADCGATGTALDRVVSAATSNGGASKEAVALLVGHASVGPTASSVGGMPAAPPTFLSTNHSGLVQQQESSTACARPHRHVYGTGPAVLMHSPHHYGTMMQHPNRHSQYAAMQQQQQQQQQQQHMMMMHHQQQQMVMMHQQQQLMMQQAQQQQAQQQQQTNKAKLKDDAVYHENDAQTERASNTERTIEDWHDGLEEEEGHEGLTQGVTMEELAAAWAQAEAEYEYEDAAVNLGAVYHQQEEEDVSTVFPYDYETTVDTALSTDTVDGKADWMKQARQLFDAGQVKDAIQACETELQRNGEQNAKAWYLLGKCHAEQDEDGKAIACLERSVEMDPYSPPALLALGVSHVNELNHARALMYLQNWMTHNPKYAGLDVSNASDDDDVYGDASAAAKETGFDEAQRLLLRAMEHDPTDSQVHEALGVVYNVSRDYDAAVSSFQKALELSSTERYSLWNKLGATLANANRSDEALPHYHSALQLRPKYARAWLNMAISHSNLKNYDEAARCYLQTLSLNPSARHCWSYLRIALSASEKWDLIPLAAKQDLSAFSQYYDFVQY